MSHLTAFSWAPLVPGAFHISSVFALEQLTSVNEAPLRAAEVVEGSTGSR
ncbi:hypothetical protein [Streptomyces adustus]